MNPVQGVRAANTATSSRFSAPPCHRGLPVVGVLQKLVSDPLAFLTSARERMGDLYEIRLPGISLVMLNHPRHVRHVFIERASLYRKRGAFWDALRGYLGNGLLVNEGESWKHIRSATEPAFRRQSLARISDLMLQGIEDGLSTWRVPTGPDQPFDIEKGMAAVSMSVSARTMFGARLTAEDAKALVPAMTYVVDSMATQMIVDSLGRWFPRPPARRYSRSLALIDDRIYRFMRSCSPEGDCADESLLSMLVRAMSGASDANFDIAAQVRDEAINLFGGAYETTKTTLTWTLHSLMKHPDVQEELLAELEQVLGERPPTFSDLGNLPYTKAVIQETLRKYPPATWILRTATEDDEIDGFEIRAGTHVVMAVYALHHHPSFWPDPASYRPARFIGEAADHRLPLSWIPFGAGPRACLGQHFAVMEAQLVLAIIFQRYMITRWPGHKVEPRLRTILKPKNGVLVRLQVRDHDAQEDI